MRRFWTSAVFAVLIAAVVQSFTIGVLAPRLPRVVGPPDVVTSKTYQLSAAHAFYLDNPDGAVHISTHTGDEITIDALVRVFAEDTAEPEVVEAFTDDLVAVSVEPGVIRVVTEPQPRPDYLDLRVDYTVGVPQGTDVTVRGSNGNVRIAKGCGAIAVYGGNTDIEINQPLGSVVAKCTNGRIRLWDGAQDAMLETVNGNVYTHMRGGSLRASTTNGAIVARILDTKVDRCNLTSLNGGITLTLADGCSARMDASTERGIVRSDLPVRYTEDGNRRRHLRGDIGDGGTKVSMETTNGSIWITRN